MIPKNKIIMFIYALLLAAYLLSVAWWCIFTPEYSNDQRGGWFTVNCFVILIFFCGGLYTFWIKE